MKKTIVLLIEALAIGLLYGCASVQVYSDNDLKGRTGLKFYSVKPYLLSEPKSEKDMTVKTSVVYLPDLANPQYLIVKPGIGSNELKMAFTNGILNSYGLTSDSNVEEMITSLAGLVGKTSDVVKQLEMKNAQLQQAPGEENFVLYEIVITTTGSTLKKIRIEE
ncbi:MAG: hypothetical protein LLG13_18620 [Bacteroidales bacterium]|nr:hypothetical protein [Bacteroidales bacterium]